jgi:hypothetical protein
MLTVSKRGRKIRTMIMSAPADRCLGVVQCALPGCEAYMAIVETGTLRDSGNVEDTTPKEQVAWFLDDHECRATGKAHPTGRTPTRRKRPHR